ncbi:hypothetical protein [Fictibacillus nanhaiensis]|uniref:hypothetical protein n=1 Tax=Fictibacillus nanhaiensis TaxID=742169 RepID=UPI003C284F9D
MTKDRDIKRLKRSELELWDAKNLVGCEIPEYGKRVKHVKELDEKYWGKDIKKSTADKFIRIYEQFGDKVPLESKITVSKFYEMLSLPTDIDVAEFITKKIKIPSTLELKTVEEMSLKELREVTKQLKEAREMEEVAERRRKEAENIWLMENEGKVTITSKQEKQILEEVKKYEKMIKYFESIEPQINKDPKSLSPKAVVKFIKHLKPIMQRVEKDKYLLENNKEEVDIIEGKIK